MARPKVLVGTASEGSSANSSATTKESKAISPKRDAIETVSRGPYCVAGTAAKLQQRLHTLRRSARVQKLQALPQPRMTQSLTPLLDVTETSVSETAVIKPESTDKAFPFLSLPAEVRNMIYRYMFRFPNGVVRTAKSSPRLQLLLANHQVYNEAVDFFYYENTFKFFAGTVTRGRDPFGLCLDRIQRCYVNLAVSRSRSKRAIVFLQRYIKQFVDTFTSKKDLKYLIVRAQANQLLYLESLKQLSGIHFVQVDVGGGCAWQPLRIIDKWPMNDTHGGFHDR
ncbi:MAG: hypothetical protein Q9166_001491 [cf. Caloplaca sp. 2 TL-2023]